MNLRVNPENSWNFSKALEKPFQRKQKRLRWIWTKSAEEKRKYCGWKSESKSLWNVINLIVCTASDAKHWELFHIFL